MSDLDEPLVDKHSGSFQKGEDGSGGDEVPRWDDLDRARVAALYIENAIHGRTALQVPNPARLSEYYVFHGSLYRGLYLAVVVLHLSLVLVEPPAIGGLAKYRPGSWAGALAELAFAAFYAADLWFEARIVHSRRFLRKMWPRAKLAAIALLALGVCVGLMLPAYEAHAARVIRPFFLIEKLRNVRKIFSSIASSTRRIVGVGFIIAFHIVFFGSAAFLIFGGGGGDAPRPMRPQPNVTQCDSLIQITPFQTSPCEDYFGRLSDDLLQLFVLLTTANYPDIALPYIRHSLWSFLYFFLFTAIGLFFLMNLVLAETYNGYMDASRSKLQKKLGGRRELLRAAFCVLTGAAPEEVTRIAARAEKVAHDVDAAAEARAAGRHGSDASDSTGAPPAAAPAPSPPPSPPAAALRPSAVTRGQWLRLLSVLRPDMRRADAKVVFDAIDVRGRGAADEVEFRALCSLVTVRFVRQPRAPRERGALAPLVRACKWLVRTRWMARFFDLLVLASAFMLVVGADVRAACETRGWDAAGHALTMLFLVEIAIKAGGLGFEGFWRVRWNRLDAAAVSLSLVGLAVSPLGGRGDHCMTSASSAGGSSLVILQIAVLVRAVRFIRVLRLLKRYDLVLTSIAALLPTLWRFMAVLFAVFYAWGVVGMDLFAGRLRADDPRVRASSYGQGDYYTLNFDQIGPAMVTLFYVLIGNNWPVVMEGAVAAYGGTAVRLYFVSFFLLSGVVVANVLVAFMLDAFSRVFEDNVRVAQGHVPRWHALLRRALAARVERMRVRRRERAARGGAAAFRDSSSRASSSLSTAGSWARVRWRDAQASDSEGSLSGESSTEDEGGAAAGEAGGRGIHGFVRAGPRSVDALTDDEDSGGEERVEPADAWSPRDWERRRGPCACWCPRRAARTRRRVSCPVRALRAARRCWREAVRLALLPLRRARGRRRRRGVSFEKRRTFNDYVVLQFMADSAPDVGIALDRLRSRSDLSTQSAGAGLSQLLAADAHARPAAFWGDQEPAPEVIFLPAPAPAVGRSRSRRGSREGEVGEDADDEGAGGGDYASDDEEGGCRSWDSAGSASPALRPVAPPSAAEPVAPASQQQPQGRHTVPAEAADAEALRLHEDGAPSHLSISVQALSVLGEGFGLDSSDDGDESLDGDTLF